MVRLGQSILREAADDIDGDMASSIRPSSTSSRRSASMKASPTSTPPPGKCQPET
jgi:hypothetical protein